MKKRNVIALLCVSVLLSIACVDVVHASLLGDDVTAQISFEGNVLQVQGDTLGPSMATVGPGIEFESQFTVSPGFGSLPVNFMIDVGDAGFDLTIGAFAVGINALLPDFMLTLSSLNWVGTAGEIVAVSALEDLPLTVGFDSDSITLVLDTPNTALTVIPDVNDVSFMNSYTITALHREQPGPSVPIPEPATLLLLGSGVAGLGASAWRRNRHKTC